MCVCVSESDYHSIGFSPVCLQELEKLEKSLLGEVDARCDKQHTELEQSQTTLATTLRGLNTAITQSGEEFARILGAQAQEP